jgi:chromosome condensin MukBEF ATPase and DNA-binding subunit MukB
MADTKSSVIPQGNAEPSVPELAQRIKDHLKEMEETTNRIKQTVLQQALHLGALLLQAKAKVAHGRFGKWLKDNCDLSERSAQRYMALKEQWPKIEAWMKDNSATVADLSLRKAEQIIAPSSNNDEDEDDDRKKPTQTPAGEYDQLEEKLIEKLKELDADEARDHADKTIGALNDTVADIVSIAKRAATKAAKLGAVTPPSQT